MSFESTTGMARANEHDPSEQRLQRIRERAYALYKERGDAAPGSAVEDWLRAERELADTVRTPRAVLNRDVGDGMSSGPEEPWPELNDMGAPTSAPATRAPTNGEARKRA